MAFTTGWSKRLTTFVVGAAIVAAACTGGSTPAPTAGPTVVPTAAESVAPYAGEAYPATAVDCANKPAGYTGTISQIKALDQYTVEFDLCASDIAFLS